MKRFKLYYTLGITLLAVLAAVLMSSAVLLLLGANVPDTFYVIFVYPLTTLNNFAGVINRMTPLLIIALGTCVAYRSGITNIGGEGQMTMGIVFTLLVGLYAPLPRVLALPLALLAGVLGGALWGMIAGALRAKFAVNELLSTVMLNYIAAQLYSFCLRVPLMDPAAIGGGGEPQTAKLAKDIWLSKLQGIFPKTSMHTGIIIALVLAVVIYLFLWRTPTGFKMRASGASSRAARYGGMNVPFYLVLAMAISGGCAGLAGGIEVLGIHHRGVGNITGGYGFSGIVVALFGGLHPAGAIPAAFFFAVLQYGAKALQTMSIAVPSNMVDVLQGIIILVIVATKMILSNTYAMERTKRRVERIIGKRGNA